ncbi:acyltransferase [Kineosporia sp. NBRC 101677]|uniref:acyltransferase family protein n=1 Tax=Kineosporia sp. NBRC 101677 TaxID=3032197 RepID=UPI002552E2A0|nr:acyltransferase [Kineosporia sp. NBRC 101677]
MTSATATPSVRLHSLDGLRGLAAAIVVVHHALMANAVLYDHSATWPSWSWVALHTPAYLLWAGAEAVTLFFVLSGFVLAAQACREGFTWRSYYPSRLVRLYLPVWASIALAGALFLAIHRTAPAGASSLLLEHRDQQIGDTFKDLILLAGTSMLNGPLWSLRWEVAFSLLLPVYVLAGRWSATSRARAAAVAAGLTLVMVVGIATHVLALQYLPVFGFGTLLFFHQDLNSALAPRLAHGLTAPALAVVAGCLMMPVVVAGWVIQPPAGAASAGKILVVFGSILWIVLALHWPPLRSFLTMPVLRWLGSRSFTIYLVHQPIIVTAAFVFDLAGRPALLLAVTAPIVLVTSEAFFRCVERPAHALSRRLVRRDTRQTSAARMR